MSSRGKRNAFSMISGSLDFSHHQDFCAEKLLFSFSVITFVPELHSSQDARKKATNVENCEKAWQQ